MLKSLTQAIADATQLVRALEAQKLTLSGQDSFTKSVSEYDTMAANLLDAKSKNQASLEVYLAQIRKARNNQILLHRGFPVEILAEVIYQAVWGHLSGANDATLRRLLALSSVCTLWREVISSSPFLWSHIHSRDGLYLIRKALSTSKSSPLSVIYTDASETIEEEFVTLLVPHVNRCRVLILYLNKMTSIRPILAAPAPLLETADLILPYGTARNEGTVDLFGGVTQRIQELAIDGISVHLGLLTTLRDLSINSFPVDGPPLSDVVAILQHNPHLTHFLFRSMSSGTEDTVDWRAIHLPHLEHLTLGGLTASSTHSLFTSIDAPACNYLSFGGWSAYPPNPSAMVAPIFQLFQQILRPVVESKGFISLVFCGVRDHFTCGVGRHPSYGRVTSVGKKQKDAYAYDLLAYVGFDTLQDLLKPVLDSILPQLLNIDVEVTIMDGPERGLEWAPWLARVPRLTKLSLFEAELPWVLEHLSNSQAYPDLNTILISGWTRNYLMPMKPMLEARYGFAQSGSGELVGWVKVFTILANNSRSVRSETFTVLDVLKLGSQVNYVLHAF